MSNVPVGRRADRTEKDPFVALHHLRKLRKEITDLMLLDFGFDKDRRDKEIERYREWHKRASNIDEVVEKWKRKADAFQSWFIDQECTQVIDITRKIVGEFEMGNSIYPTEGPNLIAEYCERRKHLNSSIGWCYVLKQEIQYIAETLPVDKNKYARFSDAIDKQISLIKGVRKSSNSFLKRKKKRDKTD